MAAFLMDAERHALRIQRGLRFGADHPRAWQPSRGTRFVIRDPKPRRITVVPFEDRVVHHVLCAALLPDLERFSIHDSYACRVGGGQQRAIRRAQRFARGVPWALKADIAAFFATVPLENLFGRLERRGPDPEVFRWVRRCVLVVRPGPERRGLAIGTLLSQHLANFYLGSLDHYVKDTLGVKRYIRYMDDLLAFGERDELRELRERIRCFGRDELGLGLNAAGTRVMPTRDGVPFLGMRVYPGTVRVRPARWRRFTARVAELEADARAGRIDEAALAQRLSSVFAHLEHYDTGQLRRSWLQRRSAARGGRLERLQPRHPGRLLEEHPGQRAGRQPQQEAPVQAQRQPGVSGLQLSVGRQMGLRSDACRPDGPGSRTGLLCHSADPLSVLRPVGLGRGTEEPRPGGGGVAVVPGPLGKKGP
ncbi:MAG: group II intron reverse transcriptase domain-containing protein [Alphaproteobacteria bacterium]|nr:group II intron reverse transcriptase domain-containing protein [Alphaproteobacteria bacterium]